MESLSKCLSKYLPENVLVIIQQYARFIKAKKRAIFMRIDNNPYSLDLRAIHRVLPGLYISGVDAITPDHLELLDISAIVNLSELHIALPSSLVSPRNKCHVYFPDDEADTKLFTRRIIKGGVLSFIHKQRVQHRSILVHCMMGISRSAAVIIAYLIWKYKFSFEGAFQHLKSCRHQIMPNAGFTSQLERLCCI